MDKIGRNDPCPCGSGKKYKKCCMGKAETLFDKPDPKAIVEDFKNYLDGFWSYEEANIMTTGELIQRLSEIGIPFDEKDFLKDTEKYYSAEDLSESWYRRFKVTARGRDEDFPYYAALILWERLAPDYNLPREKMSDLIDEGFDHLADNHAVMACDVWFKVWDGLKHRIKPEFRNLDFLDKQYNSSFFVSNFCQDLEGELHNAGIEDKSYFQKRIDYCREFCRYFPEEDELLLHNMKRAVIESFAYLGNHEQAVSECSRLVDEYPKNPWGYIQWGDLYYYFEHNQELSRAKDFYEKALTVAQNKEDILAIKERLAGLDRREWV